MITPNDPSQSSSIPEPHSQPEIITDVTQLSPEAVVDGICRLFDAKAEQLFCVFSADKRSHVQAPGLGRPWVTKNRKQAELVAKEMGGVVVDLKKAIKLMFADIVRKNSKRHNK